MAQSKIAAYLVLLVALITITAVALWWRAGDPATDEGTDALEKLAEPTSNVITEAESIMVGLHTWDPAHQQSPWDAMHATKDKLTGRLGRAAQSRPEPDPAPRQWAAWAASGDRVIGTAQGVAGQTPTEFNTATVAVEVRQVVVHPDGATTPRQTMTADVSMIWEGDSWKAEYFQFRPLVRPGT